MKPAKIAIIVLVILFVVFLLMGPFFILEEGEQAVVLRFGKIIRTETEAGLKFKVPLMDKVHFFSKKIQPWDGEAQRYPTEENQYIYVDITARWQIVDPKLFYESLTETERAQQRLDQVIDASARRIIATHPLREAVRDSNLINKIERKDVYGTSTTTTTPGVDDKKDTTETTFTSKVMTYTDIKYDEIVKGRSKLSDEMLKDARKTTGIYGIKLIDVIIRQIKYSDDITQNVYKQMIKERNQIAQAFRSDGEGEKAKWLGKTEKELREIRSGAERQAKEFKAKADAEALEIRNKAYSQSPEFAEFWMALVQYQKLLPKMKKTLTTDMEFFKFLYEKVK